MQDGQTTQDSEPTSPGPPEQPVITAKDGIYTLDKLKEDMGRLLARLREQAEAIEQRVAESVQRRATEQSAAMQHIDEAVENLRQLVLHLGDRLTPCEATVAEAKRHDAETRCRIGELSERVKGVDELARRIEQSAGDRFGKKLEALASQVANLTTIGKRLDAAEALVAENAKVVREIREAEKLADDGHRRASEQIGEALREHDRRVRALEPKTEPKPGAKEEKRS